MDVRSWWQCPGNLWATAVFEFRSSRCPERADLWVCWSSELLAARVKNVSLDGQCRLGMAVEIDGFIVKKKL
jgi:hypothetical protein